MKEKKKLTIVQAFRRMSQISDYWSKSGQSQSWQMDLIKKLYAKNGLEVIMTCGACPEQYDIFKDGKQVAYYRLRGGTFTVDEPDDMWLDGRIYYAEPNGDGAFDPEERLNYMTKAMRAVLEFINIPENASTN